MDNFILAYRLSCNFGEVPYIEYQEIGTSYPLMMRINYLKYKKKESTGPQPCSVAIVTDYLRVGNQKWGCLTSSYFSNSWW